MASQTNEQALESTIEKRLTGNCLEELKEQNTDLNIASGRTELYRTGNGYYIGLPDDFNAKYFLVEQQLTA
jgi:type I restriction enzyme R subunit